MSSNKKKISETQQTRKKIENKLIEHKTRLTKPLYNKYTDLSINPYTKLTTLKKTLEDLEKFDVVALTQPIKINKQTTTIMNPKQIIDKKTITDINNINKVVKLNNLSFKNYDEGMLQIKRVYRQLSPSDEVVIVMTKNDLKYRYFLRSSYNVFSGSKFSNHHKDTLRGIKDRFDYYYYQTFGDYQNGSGNIYIYPQNLQPKKYVHFLKEGEEYNCVLSKMKNHYNDNKEKIKIIDDLNNKYFQKGISFNNLEDVANTLKINIEIYNKCNTLIYDYCYKSNVKTFKYYLAYNDHVETFKNLFGPISQKNIIYVDNLEDEINKNNKLICYIRNSNDEINYFYDSDNLYKRKEVQEYDENSHFINSLYDLYRYKFEETNKLNNNVITNKYSDVFDFVNLSCHHVNEIFFIDNIDKNLYTTKLDKTGELLDIGIDDTEYIKKISIDDKYIDLSSCHCYDKNKAYCNYMNLEEYNTCLFPASGNFDIYKCNDIDNDDLIYILENKTGFLQIDNIIFYNKVIRKMKYFINGYIYPIPVLLWAIKNNIIDFDVISLCISNFKQELLMSDDFIDNKIYNKLFGSYTINNDKKYINMKYNDINELQDLLFYSKNIKSYTDKEITIQFDVENIKNRSHIASYIYAYNIITIFDKLKQIEYNNILGVKVDCIILKRDAATIFNISEQKKDWKIEKKGIKQVYSSYDFINDKKIYINNNLYQLSKHKIYYQKINYIMGSAGCGKTSRFYNKFENSEDERLYNMVFLFPNNNLKFQFDMEGIAKYTYHTAFNLNVKNPLNRVDYLKYNCNAVIDEASMINKDDYNKIIEQANILKINLFFVGDYNLKNKLLFQLEPPNGDSFIYNYIKGYEIELNINYRQSNNKDFYNYLQTIRGQENKDILKTLDRFNQITYNDMINLYELNDTIISPVNEFVDKCNNDLLNKNKFDVLKCKFSKTTSKYAKNQNIIINKDKYDINKYSLSYATTCHLIQGMTITGRIFINKNNLFTDNLLYVSLSRATNEKQIYIIS